MLFVFLVSLIDFSNSVIAIAKFRNERCARDSVHIRRTIIAMFDRSCTQFPRFSPSFFFFFFDLRLVNFGIRFKFQRKFRRRKAKEVRQTVTKRTATVSHFLDLASVQRMRNHCYYFVIILVW